METLVGIIPAGGRGSRLAPYPGPKELIPVGWQPYAANGEVHRRPKVVSQYVVEGMALAGTTQILMIVGEHKYDLLRYYASGERFGLSVSYLFQEGALGMVHAIDLAYPWVRDARILFGMPDTILHPATAFSRLLAHHQGRAADLTLGLFSTTRPEKFGMVAVDPTGRVTFHEDKPRRTTLQLMWGCAIWEPVFSELIHAMRCRADPGAQASELVLGRVIDEALAQGLHVAGYHFADGFYVDIGTYDELLEAQLKIANLQAANIRSETPSVSPVG